MATTVHAEFQQRDRIIFRARGRSSVNTRRMLDDGPVGYTSTELLLIALGNCSLGWLSNNALLADEPLRIVTARIEAEGATEGPPRVLKISLDIELEVTNPELLDRVAELEAIACTCPVCNSVIAEKEVRLTLRLASEGQSTPA